MGPPYPSGTRNIVPYRPPAMKFQPGPSRSIVYRNRFFNPGKNENTKWAFLSFKSSNPSKLSKTIHNYEKKVF